MIESLDSSVWFFFEQRCEIQSITEKEWEKEKETKRIEYLKNFALKMKNKMWFSKDPKSIRKSPKWIENWN